jgi:hypothetical protein
MSDKKANIVGMPREGSVHVMILMQRQVEDEIDVLEAKPQFDGLPFPEAMTRQIAEELQAGYDKTGIAGHFVVLKETMTVGGRSVALFPYVGDQAPLPSQDLLLRLLMEPLPGANDAALSRYLGKTIYPTASHLRAAVDKNELKTDPRPLDNAPSLTHEMRNIAQTLIAKGGGEATTGHRLWAWCDRVETAMKDVPPCVVRETEEGEAQRKPARAGR